MAFSEHLFCLIFKKMMRIDFTTNKNRNNIYRVLFFLYCNIKGESPRKYSKSSI